MNARDGLVGDRTALKHNGDGFIAHFEMWQRNEGEKCLSW